VSKLYGALALLGVIWSTSFLFIKLLLHDIGPFGIVFYRCLLGAITILIIMICLKVKVKVSSKRELFIIMVASLFNHALPWVLISISEQHIQSNEAAILNAFTPMATLIIGLLFFHQFVKRQQWIGLIIGMVGLGIMMNINITKFLSGNFLYSLLMIAVTLCYGVGSLLTKKYLQNMEVLVISFLTLGFSTLYGLLGSIVSGQFNFSPFTNSHLLINIIALGVMASGLAYLLFYYMVKEGSAEFATMVTYIVPIFASLWGLLFLNEPVSPRMVVGLVFVLIGVFVTNMKRKSIGTTNTTAAS
jgi:drug/metabolite transporter (DMT)-like permease